MENSIKIWQISTLFLLLTSINATANVLGRDPNNSNLFSGLNFKTLNISNSSISRTGPANQLTTGTSQSNWSATATDYSFFTCGTNIISADSGNPQTWVISTNTPINGITYTLNGVAYPIFPTGASGIGYILGVADPNLAYTPLGNKALQIFSSNNIGNTLGVKYQFRYVVTGPLKSGIINIPSQTIGNVQMRDGSTSIAGSSPIMLSSATLTVSASTCTVNTNGISVAFPPINSSNLKTIGSTSTASNFNISLTCPSGISTYMVFTDNNNMANTSNQLSLTPSSTAKGIAVQISKADGSLVSFGPDSANPGTTNQFLVLNKLSGIQSLPFSARIIRTAAITPGNFTATSTFTFSYQ
jgi:type 1 fimbria pilin